MPSPYPLPDPVRRSMEAGGAILLILAVLGMEAAFLWYLARQIKRYDDATVPLTPMEQNDREDLVVSLVAVVVLIAFTLASLVLGSMRAHDTVKYTR